ncbi:growth-regulating factor 6-like isoform X2 [Tasmannia lanceolata]|uniref:growth-regulating factor 6-like isoform X2 n=1 Tax=Tasmannia lanceolata TaxID=3420 RepID=UPI004062AE37
MDFGVVSFDDMVGSENGFSSLVSEAETSQKECGSGFLKHGRSGLVDDDWGSFKMARTDDFEVSKAMPLLESNSIFPNGQEQMLSFSSSKQEALLVSNDGLVERGFQNGTLPYYSSYPYARNPGFKGPFTRSQWMELEHQALIYKFINANEPIPPNLLVPFRKAFNPSGFTGFSSGSLRPNTSRWGSFHLGFCGNTDPEPGRCRRTDGKKWRCSRDAVPDQKYCERHMNRGRHRSRKPVEGQTGHAATNTAAAKVMPITPSVATAVLGSDPSKNFTIGQQQINGFHPGGDPSATHISRILMNKSNVGNRMQDTQSLSILPSVNLKSKDSPFPIIKQQTPYEDPFLKQQTEFGLISSDTLLSPQRYSYMESRNINSSTDPNDRDPQAQSLRHFIDEWPNNQADCSAITWPDMEEIQPDSTQLSISIPVASSDFSSPSSSPTDEKASLSPLRLSREFYPFQMDLGVGEGTQRRASWMPISWENSMGGPLGEVLNISNTPREYKNNSSALNLLTEGWDGSPPLGSSPTGVLQKTSFGSSNSSTGSSPRADNNKTHMNTSLYDDLLGSTPVSSSITSLQAFD